MAEERDDLIVLVDEDGEEVEFEHLDTIEMEKGEYVVLLPTEELTADDEEIDEVVILKVDYLEDGEETFVSVEDEQELNTVFEEFKRRVQEQFNFDD